MEDELQEQLNRIEQGIASLRAHLDKRLDRNLERLVRIMATLDETLAAVTDENTKDDSIIALLAGLKAQLDAATAGGLTPAVQAKVDQIFAQATANSGKIVAAIAANTPPAA